MENRSMQSKPSVPPGTFMRGFISGAGTGALMVGIFYASMAALSLVPGAGLAFSVGWNLLGVFAASVFSTGMFSGIMATRRAHNDINAAYRDSQPAGRAAAQAASRSPEQHYAPVVVPAMERAINTQQQWTTRVQSTGHMHDRISDIIASRAAANTNDHASRVEAGREQQQAAAEAAR